MQHALLRRCGPTLGVALWLLLVYCGWWRLGVYDNTPAATTTGARYWPSTTRLSHSHTDPTLVMAVHPHCSCTRASLDELARVLASRRGHVPAYLLFVLPPGVSQDWARTDLWTKAARIPGVHVHLDPGGAESARFGVTTSGHCLLFAADGRQIFSGGITPSRGQEGQNTGRDTLISLITGDPGTQARAPRGVSTPVFGCSLTAKETL